MSSAMEFVIPRVTPAPDRLQATGAVDRRLLAAIVGGFALAFVAVLWLVTAKVVVEYVLTCERGAMRCAVTRAHLVGSERFEFRIPADARAEVRVTPRKNRAAPRTFLELVNPTGRRFLIEYEWGDAEGRAASAAARLNAFLTGEGGEVIREVEGSRGPVWGILTFLITLTGLSVVAWRSRTASGSAAQ